MDDTTGVSAPQPTGDLVTSEGVNEGSRKSAAESAGTAPPQEAEPLTRGGRPEMADEQDQDSARHDAEHEVVAGPWGATEASAPSLEQSIEEQRARS